MITSIWKAADVIRSTSAVTAMLEVGAAQRGDVAPSGLGHALEQVRAQAVHDVGQERVRVDVLEAHEEGLRRDDQHERHEHADEIEPDLRPQQRLKESRRPHGDDAGLRRYQLQHRHEQQHRNAFGDAAQQQEAERRRRAPSALREEPPTEAGDAAQLRGARELHGVQRRSAGQAVTPALLRRGAWPTNALRASPPAIGRRGGPSCTCGRTGCLGSSPAATSSGSSSTLRNTVRAARFTIVRRAKEPSPSGAPSGRGMPSVISARRMPLHHRVHEALAPRRRHPQTPLLRGGPVQEDGDVGDPLQPLPVVAGSMRAKELELPVVRQHRDRHPTDFDAGALADHALDVDGHQLRIGMSEKCSSRAAPPWV